MTDLLALPRRLRAALPRAWAADRVFRIAVIGAAVALVVLLGRLGLGESPDGTDAPSAVRAPLPPPGTRYEPPVTGGEPEPAPSGPLAPGRGLDGVTITRDPGAPADRFGTSRP